MATDPAGNNDDDERWHLADRAEFLRRSLADAAREHDAGDLSDEDHALLVARDSARLVEVEAELAAIGADADADAAAPPPAVPDAETPERRPMPAWRRAGIAGACLLIALGVVILVVHSLQGRQPGQASSGGVTLSQAQTIEQQLSQALALNNEGNTKSALELYDKVLSEDPSNPAALAYAGYLQWNVGSSAHVTSLARIGAAEVRKSVSVSPSYYEGHLFLGLILSNQDHDDAAAVVQFNDFLADDPPSAEPPQVASLVVGAYQGAGVPVPSAFTSGTSTSSP